MSYFLHNWSLKVEQEDIECQASQLLWKFLFANREYNANFEEIVIMMKCVGCKIPAGTEYLCYEFVDENGELFEFDCRVEVNKLMLKRKIYPTFIDNAIVNFKNNYYEQKNNSNT